MASGIVSGIKWITAYLYIRLHQKFTKRRFDLYDMEAKNDPVKIGILPPEEEKILESPATDLHLNRAADEVFFYGVNSSSEYFLARISRRYDEEADVGLYLRLKNGNTYQIEESCSSYRLSKHRDKVFAGKGLKMYYTEPMRKWRIFYKGLLREFSKDGTSKMVYVKFGLQWRSSTDCFDTLSDISNSELAKSFSRTKWNGWLPDLKRLKDTVNSYYQCGVIRGEVYLGGVDEATELYLFGGKMRNLGTASNIEGYRFSHLLGYTTKNGMFVNISELHIPGLTESLVYGYIVSPEGKLESSTNMKMTKCRLSDNAENIDIKLHAGGFDFTLTAESSEERSAYELGKEKEYNLSMKMMDIELNSFTGKGIFLKGSILKPRLKKDFQLIEEDIGKDAPLVVNFLNSVCQIPELTGGKGSSLGKLSQLSREYQEFIVPEGIVVTTSAYQKFITEDILEEVKNLADILYGNSPGDVKQACQRVMDKVITAALPNEVRESITENLQKEFEQGFLQKSFAVRSSATGEDSEEMSAAGQMETYLGVSGLEEIMLSVKKCWASQFSYVAVQYKRQNGQLLNSPMAVVIQEMVSCDVAGVVFSCDPLTGNPLFLNITANYGLGESVVSGAEEPDTIVLERTADGNLKIKKTIVGAKKHRIVIKGGSPSSEEIPEEHRSTCSLSESLCLRLGNIALNIEKNYGSERDIEWGYVKDDFYIFQSRPVTSINEETDYEIDHENDMPMRVENEYFGKANMGEVFPGATSPLGQEIVFKLFNYGMARRIYSGMRPFQMIYCPKGMLSMYNHAMMLGSEFYEMAPDNTVYARILMLMAGGVDLNDDELYKLAMERIRYRKKQSAKRLFFMVKFLFTSVGILKRMKKYYACNKLNVENYKTSSDLFEALVHSCTYAYSGLLCHHCCSMKSVVYNFWLLLTIQKNKGELNMDTYNDMSELLSSITGIESADVPSSMESLARCIAEEIPVEEFKKMSVEEAESWLLSSTSESGKQFHHFLQTHGHRCLKEFDIRTHTWEEEPKHVVKLLQSLVGSVSKDQASKKTKTFEEIQGKLKTPLSFKNRMFLKFLLLPLSRSAVQGREGGKSVLIQAIHEWRKGYRKLARLMVSEGRIPDEDLLYFMSLLEIQELLKTRSPRIIARALHRRRRFPVLESYMFPIICRGIPKPVNLNNDEIIHSEENFSMQGIPVSKGVAKGFVRVAVNLDEESFLKPGEILLTYSTDIGWTPYFPALAGLAIELGGLTSHGAVVSREYGLPCIAGLHGATRCFQTGDYILLDANKGIIQKLPHPG